MASLLSRGLATHRRGGSESPRLPGLMMHGMCGLRPLGPLPRLLLPGVHNHQPASTMSASEGELSGGGVIPDVVDGVGSAAGAGLRLRFGSKACEGGVEFKPSQVRLAWARAVLPGDSVRLRLMLSRPPLPLAAGGARAKRGDQG